MDGNAELVQASFVGGHRFPAYPAILRIFREHSGNIRSADQHIQYGAGGMWRSSKLFRMVTGRWCPFWRLDVLKVAVEMNELTALVGIEIGA